MAYYSLIEELCMLYSLLTTYLRQVIVTGLIFVTRVDYFLLERLFAFNGHLTYCKNVYPIVSLPMFKFILNWVSEVEEKVFPQT